MVPTILETDNFQLVMLPVQTARLGCLVDFCEYLIRVMDCTGRVIPAAQFMTEIKDTSLRRDIDMLSSQLALQLFWLISNLLLWVNTLAP